LALAAAKFAAPTIEGIEFAEADSAVTTYPIVALASAPNAPAAAAFTAFVLGTEGANILSEAGFGPR
jgi:molybdate transport system substrate-binding protein